MITIISTLMFVACKQTKQDKVEELLTSTNKFDKEKVGQQLSDSLIYIDETGKSYNKTAYLKLIDSLKRLDIKTEIISIKENDNGTVSTIEKYTTILDTFLLKDDTAKFLVGKTYMIHGGKVISIKTDTNANPTKFSESLNDRINVLFLYAADKHNEKDKETIYSKMKEYVSEYSNLSVSDKKAYRIYSYIQGTYLIDDKKSVGNSKGLNSLMSIAAVMTFAKLTFKGKKSVIATGWFDQALSYDLDENYIRIQSGEGFMFMLKIKDRNTLINEEYGLVYNRIK